MSSTQQEMPRLPADVDAETRAALQRGIDDEERAHRTSFSPRTVSRPDAVARAFVRNTSGTRFAKAETVAVIEYARWLEGRLDSAIEHEWPCEHAPGGAGACEDSNCPVSRYRINPELEVAVPLAELKRLVAASQQCRTAHDDSRVLTDFYATAQREFGSAT